MMSNRHSSIGIKQVIPYEWMRRTVGLMLAGQSPKQIRQELHASIALEGRHTQSGDRSSGTRTFLVNNLMAIWPSPAHRLISFRDTALRLLRSYSEQERAIHWAMISASYPFWFNTAEHTGRLLNLQAQVSQTQIVSRLKEQYGDRQTVSRYARFVVRSFVDWGVIEDTTVAGCYKKARLPIVVDQELTLLLLHAALLAIPEGKAPLGVLQVSPSFFPFEHVALCGQNFPGRAGRLKVVHNGLDNDLLTLAT